eukprot:1333655-Amphidinium_carterae.1
MPKNGKNGKRPFLKKILTLLNRLTCRGAIERESSLHAKPNSETTTTPPQGANEHSGNIRGVSAEYR